MRFTSKNSKKNYRALACAMAMVTGLSAAQIAYAAEPSESGVIVNMSDGKLKAVSDSGAEADIDRNKKQAATGAEVGESVENAAKAQDTIRSWKRRQ